MRVHLLLVPVVLGLLLPGCTAALPGEVDPESSPTPEPTVTGPPIDIGAGPDVESQLLAGIMDELLTVEGIATQVEEFDDRNAVRQALELGAIDLAIGYTAEAWLEVLGRPDPPGDPEVSFRRVREDDRGRGLFWMRPEFSDDVRIDTPPANATFAFFVQAPPLADAPALRTMTQFASRVVADPDARVCVDEEFGSRPDGLSAVWRAYSVDPQHGFTAAQPEDAVFGVAAGDCLAGLTTATDGEAWAQNLRPLIDDRRVFPAFVITPVVREVALERHPQLLAALNPLPEGLTTRLLGEWNARLSGAGPSEVEEVATEAARTLLLVAGRPSMATLLESDTG